MDAIVSVTSTINSVIWHDYALLAVLGAGVLFTFWNGFGQYRALTHGVAVVTGKYDEKGDPGAINHFQALSTALSATVGLGNIAGVAIAISLGGPGALFWMWMVGVVGMCLKMTEVTQSMMFRDTSDPGNPHGGPMWVAHRGFRRLSPALAPVGTTVGVIFSLTLLVSTATGGNMFQAWNVADISFTYFGLPHWIAGVILTLAVGVVIVGGIRRIGEIAGRIVPFMCAAYLLAGFFVIAVNIADVPAMFALIFSEAFSPSEGVGAFIGGTAGYGFLKGLQRAFFSSEAGQGSAPIAHSAAKTEEPVREGIVSGLEPFIDTIVVCTVTGLVILTSGVWNRDPALVYDAAPVISPVAVNGEAAAAAGDIDWRVDPVGVTVSDELIAQAQMREGAIVFVVVESGTNAETGLDRSRVFGTLTGSEDAGWSVEFDQFSAPPGVIPALSIDGVFFDFKGASLTAKAFDRAVPGLGAWLVPVVAWLFAFSTIISWGYYGEQGIVYLFRRFDQGQRAVMPYRVVYCLLILLSVQFIRTQDELDLFSTFGTGLMLWVNVPIMLIFARMSMRAHHDYFGRLRKGEMTPTR